MLELDVYCSPYIYIIEKLPVQTTRLARFHSPINYRHSKRLSYVFTVVWHKNTPYHTNTPYIHIPHIECEPTCHLNGTFDNVLHFQCSCYL